MASSELGAVRSLHDVRMRAMPIDVEWQDETGAVLARYDGPSVDVALVERASADSCCLRFIDPWGDTTFNQHQIEILFTELRRLADDATEAPHVRAQADAVAEFVGRARGEVHTYVKFSGD